MMKILYETENRLLNWKPGDTLLEICLKNKIDIHHSCEGMASCGTCRVLIQSSNNDLPNRNPLEQEMAEDRGFCEQERLACQLVPENDIQFILARDKN